MEVVVNLFGEQPTQNVIQQDDSAHWAAGCSPVSREQLN